MYNILVSSRNSSGKGILWIYLAAIASWGRDSARREGTSRCTLVDRQEIDVNGDEVAAELFGVDGMDVIVRRGLGDLRMSEMCRMVWAKILVSMMRTLSFHSSSQPWDIKSSRELSV